MRGVRLVVPAFVASSDQGTGGDRILPQRNHSRTTLFAMKKTLAGRSASRRIR